LYRITHKSTFTKDKSINFGLKSTFIAHIKNLKSIRRIEDIYKFIPSIKAIAGINIVNGIRSETLIVGASSFF
jgi:hypothetical protein